VAEAERLYQLVVKLHEAGRYAEAVPLAQQCAEIRKKALGQDHPEYGNSLSRLALLYEKTGQYAEAESLHLEAMRIDKKAFGEQSAPYTCDLRLLALLYESMGQYEKAEPLYLRAMQIDKNVGGEESSFYADDLDLLAWLYESMGRYREAEPLLVRAAEIQAKVLGEDHLDHLASLNSLAQLYMSMGQYEKAESVFVREMHILERRGNEHPGYTGVLSALGNLYAGMNELEKAERFSIRVMDIVRLAYGENHPVYAGSLNNLAALYMDMGEYEKAEPLYVRASENLRHAYEENQPRYAPLYAASLNNVAGLYRRMGKYEKGQSAYLRAAEVSKKLQGVDQLGYVLTLDGLGGLYYRMGKYDKAAPLFMLAAETLKGVVGKEHECYPEAMFNLAVTHVAMGLWREALDNQVDGMAAQQPMLRHGFRGLTEEHRLAYLHRKECGLHVLISMTVRSPTPQTSARVALDWVLCRKGIVLSSMLEERQALRLAADPKTRELWEKLRSTQSQLARAVYGGPGKEGAEAYPTRCGKLSAQVDELQKSLALKSHAFRDNTEAMEADVQKVSAALPGGTALVEVVIYQVFDFHVKGEEERYKDDAYVCFILKSGEKTPVMIDLGKAEPIDAAVSGFRKAIREANQAIADKGEAQAEKELARAGQALYQQVWSKIEPHLKDVTRVYLSPDGDLNLVSFGALQDNEEKYLAERYVFDYLASGRDLLRPRAGESGKKELVAFADPEFGGSAAQGTLMVSRDVFRSAVTDRGILGELRFPPLPGTRDECKAIADLAGKRGLSVESHVGAEATEAALKNISAPRILHLATHGFFLPDTEWKKASPQDRFEIARFGESKPRASALLLHNPMHRSGLALAGAARAIKDEQLAAGQEDGLVTAEEVVTLDLEGTKLVTLSACESGVGEVKRGEGVMGLRRAFIMAGTEGLLMTLWNVPDVSTRDLMVKFYERYLETGDGPESLAEAQRVIIAERRAKSGAAHPFYWGAFVITGAEK
jgi:CHAT domain-containing protein/Tfp pilus assembly protein PilF